MKQHAIVARDHQDVQALSKAYRALLAGCDVVRVAFLSGRPGVQFTQAHRAVLHQKVLTNV